jgi:lysophospholipase L1-like esterase
VVDLARLRRDRLAKVQRAMAAQNLAMVLTDIVNIRYCTGVAEFRQRALWRDVRPSMFWQAHVTDADFPGKAAAWARQIRDVLAAHYEAVATGTGPAFLDVGTTTHADGIDGVHLSASAHRSIGVAVAAKIRALLE